MGPLYRLKFVPKYGMTFHSTPSDYMVQRLRTWLRGSGGLLVTTNLHFSGMEASTCVFITKNIAVETGARSGLLRATARLVVISYAEDIDHEEIKKRFFVPSLLLVSQFVKETDAKHIIGKAGSTINKIKSEAEVINIPDTHSGATVIKYAGNATGVEKEPAELASNSALSIVPSHGFKEAPANEFNVSSLLDILLGKHQLLQYWFFFYILV